MSIESEKDLSFKGEFGGTRMLPQKRVRCRSTGMLFELFFMDTMFKKIFLFKCEIATFWFLASQHYYFSIAPGMASMGQVSRGDSLLYKMV